MSIGKENKLLVSDIDNTLFNWVQYYSKSFSAMLDKLSVLTEISAQELAQQCSCVFKKYGSIEYPFVLQELAVVQARYGGDFNQILKEIIEPCRKAFMDIAIHYLVPYEEVISCLNDLKKQDVKIVALTDSPTYLALWKLNKLGILNFFDGVYGLENPKLPIYRGKPWVSEKILLRYLDKNTFAYEGRVRELSEEYEKPTTKGLQTVLMDFDIDYRDLKEKSVVWLGDNLCKDIPMGNKLSIKTVWARYGIKFSQDDYQRINTLSEPERVAKNMSPSHGSLKSSQIHTKNIIDNFSQIKAYI